MDRYQAVKRKGTRIIQKCNELLNAMKKETDSSPEKLNGPPTEKIPKKSPKKIICQVKKAWYPPPIAKEKALWY